MGNIRNWEKLYEVKGPKSLLDMSAVELAERQKECDTIVLSFGAIENHSSHLPLGADWFQGNALIKCVAEELEAMGHKAIPGFCVPFGVQTRDSAFRSACRPTGSSVFICTETAIFLR